MKKIIFVVDNLNIGGVEKSLVTMLNNININKYEIDILPLVSGGIYEEKLKELNVNILPIPKTKYDTSLLSSSFKKTIIYYLKHFKILKIFNLFVLFFKGKRNNLIKNLSLAELIRCSIIDSYDFINYNYDFAIGYIDRQYSYFASKKIKSNKKIMWIHSDYDVVGSDICGYSEIYQTFNNIVCVSNKAKNSFLCKFPVLEKKIVVINDMLDLDMMLSSPIYNFNNNCIKLVSVGRLSPEKRFIKLIENFHVISKSVDKDIILYIIGDGPERLLIESKIREYGLTDNVILLGRQENPYQFIKSADIFLQPSIKEGYCLTVYEAYFLNKFIIAFNIADVNDIIKNGVNGFICENDDDFVENTIKTISTQMYKFMDYKVDLNYNKKIGCKIEKIFDEKDEKK